MTAPRGKIVDFQHGWAPQAMGRGAEASRRG
jgi:hypothetical protein